jgi:hypothetical protein
MVNAYEVGAADGVRLDDVLGLVPGPGQEGWWTIERRERRDVIIRATVCEFFADDCPTRQSSALARRLDQYRAAGWKTDRAFKAPPKKYRGRIEAELFRILKLGPAPKARTIRAILAVNHNS